MTTFRNFILQKYGIEMPQGNIPANWFAENGLPMVIACTVCHSSLVTPAAWVDNDGYCYCGDCVGAED